MSTIRAYARRRRELPLTRRELDALIAMIMRIAENAERSLVATDDDGEEDRPELLALWERERKEYRELMHQRAARQDAAEAREARVRRTPGA